VKLQWWSRDTAVIIPNLGARRVVFVNATPRPLYPREKNFCYHCTGGWAGHRDDRDECGEENIS
jgi:hypothetical protein